jgi:hypothetical protein
VVNLYYSISNSRMINNFSSLQCSDSPAVRKYEKVESDRDLTSKRWKCSHIRVDPTGTYAFGGGGRLENIKEKVRKLALRFIQLSFEIC